MSQQDQDEAMAQADKIMEERANRAKQLLSQRYRGLRHEQVSHEFNSTEGLEIIDTNPLSLLLGCQT